jgi:hypothetical protein
VSERNRWTGYVSDASRLLSQYRNISCLAFLAAELLVMPIMF